MFKIRFLKEREKEDVLPLWVADMDFLRLQTQ